MLKVWAISVDVQDGAVPLNSIKDTWQWVYAIDGVGDDIGFSW